MPFESSLIKITSVVFNIHNKRMFENVGVTYVIIKRLRGISLRANMPHGMSYIF